MCSGGSGCPHRLLQRSVPQRPCSLAWMSHVPNVPLLRGRGLRRGQKPQRGRGGQAQRSRSPGTDKSTTLDLLFLSRLAIFFFQTRYFFSPRSLYFHSPCFPCWGEALSLSYPSTGSAPITLSSQHHRFDLYRRQANYTPERGDVLPKLGAFKAARVMSSSHCPVPVPPRPPGIRVSSHDAAVTAAAEEGFEQEGGEQTGRRRLSCGGGEGSTAAGHSSSPFPLHSWVFIRMRERGAEE